MPWPGGSVPLQRLGLPARRDANRRSDNFLVSLGMETDAAIYEMNKGQPCFYAFLDEISFRFSSVTRCELDRNHS